ncbi:MAG: hypothetical protein C0618_02720 [Desulfuromonas sp.]|nr:MAG: hypothetical protein C0618_02720 [Desulfuromonas sp.]
MNTELQQEIERALADGVAHPDNLPFLLSPAHPSPLRILLVHGFGATPREMRSLAELLSRQGHSCFAVRLPGHGTSPEDLAGRRYEEWVETARRGHELLSQGDGEVVAIGQSTGALVLLQLALDHPLKALILLSPFLRLQHRLAPFAGWLHPLRPYQKRSLAATERPFYYERRPIKGVHQINRLRRRVRRNLHRITVPTLILAAAGDRTVAAGTARRLYEKLGSSDKRFYCYGAEVPHVLTTADNPRQQDTFTRISDFLQQLDRPEQRD